MGCSKGWFGRFFLALFLLSSLLKITVDKWGYIIFIILLSNATTFALYTSLASLATSSKVVLHIVIVIWARVF